MTSLLTAMQVYALRLACLLAPTWAAAPVPDLLERSVKDKERVAKARTDPLAYHGHMRLATARTLLDTTALIDSRLAEVRRRAHARIHRCRSTCRCWCCTALTTS